MDDDLPDENRIVWERYLTLEQTWMRQQALTVLDDFIRSLGPLPTHTWHPWARRIALDKVDHDKNIPIRFPLFRSVIFPALLAGLGEAIPGAARGLAGLVQLLYKSPACWVELPEDLRTERGLLRRALRDDPSDLRAKKGLLEGWRYSFDYALHELPTGVLYGQDGASIEECTELLEELADYELLAQSLGMDEEDRERITSARFHFIHYRSYLSERGRWASYEEFLGEAGASGSTDGV